MKKIEAVLFDLDGTLIDSEQYYFDCCAPVLKEHFDLSINMDDWMRDFVGHTVVQNVVLLKEKWKIDTTADYLEKHMAVEAKKHDIRKVKLMPYVRELIHTLAEKKIRMAVVTSSPFEIAQITLKANDVFHYFDFFVTSDDVKNHKPDPEPYQLALNKLALEDKSIIVLEDSYAGLVSAQKAGLKVFAINSFEVLRKQLTQADALFYNAQELYEKWFNIQPPVPKKTR